jgi:hypothetical protein
MQAPEKPLPPTRSKPQGSTPREMDAPTSTITQVYSHFRFRRFAKAHMPILKNNYVLSGNLDKNQ